MFKLNCEREDFEMKNISKLILGVSAFAFSQTANAAIFQPAGVYTLSGTVTVEKDLAPLECELEVTITVPEDAPDSHGSFSHGDSATATAQFVGGDFGCTFIDVAGTADVIATAAGGQEYLTFDHWVITPPFSSGQCDGTITAAWFDLSAGASPSYLEASSPLSDSTATAGADCKIVGRLTDSNLQITP